MMKKKNQLFYLKLVKNFYAKFKKVKYHSSFDTPVYLAAVSGDSIGENILNKIIGYKNSILKKLLINLKDCFYAMNFSTFKIKRNKNYFSNNYKNIVITWAFKKDFNKDGSLFDYHLNINSKNVNKTLWFVIYLDKKFPNKIKNNLFLFQPISKKSYNILEIFKIVYKNIKYIFINVDYFLMKISNYENISKKISKFFFHNLKENIEKILILYEGQPFQSEILRLAKSKYKIKTIGYVHGAPVAFPSNYIKKKFSPDIVYLTGKDQLYTFSKLGWKKKDLKVCNSLRFLKGTRNFRKKILLPMSIKSENKLIKNIIYLSNKFDISKYEVQPHPATSSFQKIKKLRIKILSIINSKKKNKTISYPIFVGATGAIVEYLEYSQNKAIHITESEIIEKYSTSVWPSISVKEIKDDIFEYKLRKKGNLLKFGNKPKNLNIFFK